MNPITVVLPVGPYPNDKKWLPKCLESIQNQTFKDFAVQIIADGSSISDEDMPVDVDIPIRVYRPLWRVGPADAWNFGVGVGSTKLYFFMSADDLLEPNCLEECYKKYEAEGKRDGYYYVSIRYMDDDSEQGLPCNAAMVTKDFWTRIGGFPPEAGVGAPDALIISALMVHEPGALIQVSKKPLYNVRRHEHQETARMNRYFGAIHAIRDAFTTYAGELWRA